MMGLTCNVKLLGSWREDPVMGLVGISTGLFIFCGVLFLETVICGVG